jgi:hypothetical protein
MYSREYLWGRTTLQWLHNLWRDEHEHRSAVLYRRYHGSWASWTVLLSVWIWGQVKRGLQHRQRNANRHESKQLAVPRSNNDNIVVSHPVNGNEDIFHNGELLRGKYGNSNGYILIGLSFLYVCFGKWGLLETPLSFKVRNRAILTETHTSFYYQLEISQARLSLPTPHTKQLYFVYCTNWHIQVRPAPAPAS